MDQSLAITFKSNRHTRPLLALSDLPDGVADSEFDYLDRAALAETGEDYSPRFFSYRGAWYDLHEFEVAPDNYKRHGWDGWHTESAFSAAVVTYFDRDGYELDGEVIVGYAHW